MKELCLLKINEMIQMCETWIEIERKTKKEEDISLVIPKLEIIINDLKQLARMQD